MPTLFALHLSRHVRGMVKGPVHAVPAMYAGVLCSETKEIVKPDAAAMRECLPACYRAAFDRTQGNLWFSNDEASDAVHGKRAAYVALRSSRGKYLNTLYAIPYVKAAQ